MRKKFLLCMIFVLILSNTVYASDWKGYFAIGWDNVTEFVSGVFHGKKSQENISFDISSDILSNDEQLPKHLSSNWDKLTGSLTKALKLQDDQEKLPKKSWFGRDKKSNAKKINELLNQALGILVQGDASDMRRIASENRTKISELKNELDKTRNLRISAPEKSKLPWKLTRSKADEKISKLEEEIKDREESINEINSKLADALKEIGLELDQSQIDILLNSVTGDDLIQNTIVFANVKIVVEKLEELSKNDNNTFDINRRYTGMYLVLNDLLIHTQEELVGKIDGKYKPELDAIIKEADSLQKEALTRSVQNVYNESQRKSFAMNAESNAMTIKVAELYISLLNSQRSGTLESIKTLRLNRDLAENTYKTVKSSGELRSLIHSGLTLFDSVNALSMPELKPFESEAMRHEFEEINRRLKK